jgi:hypothetical protein
MRARLIRLAAAWAASILILSAAPALAGARGTLVRVSGVPRQFVQAPTLNVSLTVRSRSVRQLHGWLAGVTRLLPVRLHPSRAGGAGALPLSVSIPRSLMSGRYRLLICTQRHAPKRLPAPDCVSSHAISIVAAIPVLPGHNPVTVHPSADDSLAQTQTVGPQGGVLSATADDGSQLRLSIPAGALAGPEQITLSPLTGLGGSPVRFVAGADLQPAGLRLLAPATLQIFPAHRVSPARQVAFGYESGGTQFGLLPLADARTVTIPLLRLLGTGLASAGQSERARLQGRAPSDPEAALLAQLAGPLESVRRERSGPPFPGQSQPELATKGLLGGYFNRFVTPALRSATRGPAAWMSAASVALGWREEVAQLGFRRAFSAQQGPAVQALFGATLGHVWQQLTSNCAGPGKIGTLESALTLGRVAEALGDGGALGGSGVIDAGIAACSQMSIQTSVAVQLAQWQPADVRNPFAQILSTVTFAGTMSFHELRGINQLTFTSPQLPISEQVPSWTESTFATGEGCSDPALVAVSSDPAQMYAVLSGTLTVPADLFDFGAPPWSLGVAVTGADQASWSMTCPPGLPKTFQQPPGAMSALAAITAVTPIVFTPTAASRQFRGSADILGGSTIAGVGNANGTASVNVPQSARDRARVSPQRPSARRRHR